MSVRTIPAEIVARVAFDNGVPFRLRLWMKQGGRCFWCSRPMDLAGAGSNPRYATIEHVKPKSAGGGSEFRNLRAACLRCNMLRGSMSEQHFRFFINAFGASLPEWGTPRWRALVASFANLHGMRPNTRIRLPARTAPPMLEAAE